MGRFKFDLATESDDLELQEIIKSNPVGGNIRVSYQRYPSIFHSVRTLGKRSQVIVARDMEYDCIVGFGIRSIRSSYVNGKAVEIGYLSGLRVREEYRKSTLLGRGYSFFRKLHERDNIPLYISTIIESNVDALSVLTSRKGGIPTYYDIGRYSSYALKVSGKTCRIARGSAVKIARGGLERISEVVDFLNRENARYQFAPQYHETDFHPGSPLLLGFSPDDFYLALTGGGIVGVLAKWDQSLFKQNIVVGYGTKLALLKPFYNVVARMARFSPLPSIGQKIKMFYVSMVAIENNDPQIFEALLRKISDDNTSAGYSHMMVGLHERNHLNRTVQRWHPISYQSRLYAVCWEDGEKSFKSLDQRIPHVELAAL